MRVDEVMTKGVATVRADASISDAIATMEARHISGVPVTDDGGALVGMLTEGDLLKRVETGYCWASPGRMARRGARVGPRCERLRADA